MVRRRARPGLTRAAGSLAGLTGCATDSAGLSRPRFRERIAVARAAGFTAFLNRHS